MAGKNRNGATGRFKSQAQQRYIFGVLAHKDPSAAVWARKWALASGETGGRTPPSRAAYHALPKRKGLPER